MRISIIMPSYNQSSFVEAAIQSVLLQDYEDWELLFIDGGSTDATLDVVQPYLKHMAQFISTPDNGQSDAMARGFSLATGDLLTWLNTDDILLPGALSTVARAAKSSSNCEWYMGNVVWIDADDRIIKCRRGESYHPLWPRLGLLAATGPTTFFSKGLYHRVGGLNQSLHYQMDTELWWRFILSGARFHRLDGYTWCLRLHANAKVSGHLFNDINDPKTERVGPSNPRESAIIEELAASHRIIPNKALSRVLVIGKKMFSFSNVRSHVESHVWHGRNVREVFKA